MAREGHSLSIVFAAWIVGAVLSIFGALSYAGAGRGNSGGWRRVRVFAAWLRAGVGISVRMDAFDCGGGRPRRLRLPRKVLLAAYFRDEDHHDNRESEIDEPALGAGFGDAGEQHDQQDAQEDVRPAHLLGSREVEDHRVVGHGSRASFSCTTIVFAQERTCDGSRQSPECSLAIARAGKPVASGFEPATEGDVASCSSWIAIRTWCLCSSCTM